MIGISKHKDFDRFIHWQETSNILIFDSCAQNLMSWILCILIGLNYGFWVPGKLDLVNMNTSKRNFRAFLEDCEVFFALQLASRTSE